MSVFVLVHGSWHDGSAWEGVIRHLEGKGHKAFAPTAIGYGKGANKRVTHIQCVKSIVDFISAKSLSDFVLLGHSFGGTFISKVAEAIPERIRRLVFQNAFVVRDGYSVLDESHLKKFYSLEIPKSYINCTEDIALPPGEWGWHPRMSNRLGLYRLVQMPGSHEVMFTNPAGLAEKILEAGRD